MPSCSEYHQTLGKCPDYLAPPPPRLEKNYLSFHMEILAELDLHSAVLSCICVEFLSFGTQEFWHALGFSDDTPTARRLDKMHVTGQGGHVSV